MKTPPPARELLTYTTLVGLVAYAAIATDLYLPAIPYMIADLAGTQADGQLTLSVFMVGLAVGQLVFGPLSDQFGRLPVVRIGTLCFLITSVLCAVAQSMEMMWALRGLQGAAAASGPVIARAIVRDRYEGNRGSGDVGPVRCHGSDPYGGPQCRRPVLRFFPGQPYSWRWLYSPSSSLPR